MGDGVRRGGQELRWGFSAIPSRVLAKLRVASLEALVNRAGRREKTMQRSWQRAVFLA